MMTSSNGNIFRVTGHLCGEFTGPGEFPAQRPVTQSFDVFFDLRLNKRLSKQPWGWWFETPSWSLWRHCNAGTFSYVCMHQHAKNTNKAAIAADKTNAVILYYFLHTGFLKQPVSLFSALRYACQILAKFKCSCQQSLYNITILN